VQHQAAADLAHKKNQLCAVLLDMQNKVIICGFVEDHRYASFFKGQGIACL